MADKFRIGLVYYSAGQRVCVEAGFRRIGYTQHDPKIGQQVYWFPSVAEFERVKRTLFEAAGRGTIHFPVPVVQEIEPAPAPVATPKPEPVAEVQTAGEADGKPSESYTEESGSIPEPVTAPEEPAPVKNKGGRPRKHQ